MLLLKNELSEVYCHINYNEHYNTIYTQWECKVSLAEVKEAVNHILELQKKVKASAFLSNYTNCKGFEQHTIDFLNQEFFPKLATNGIERHAFVFSNEVFNRLMHHTFSTYYENFFEVDVFNCLQKGNNWLQSSAIKSAS